ncbi:thioredoxin domain-containing protein [Alkalilimnicola ehrlichii MLHE-1]|uniref:Spermatogenesis-associated protein 20-like TRX domain-containing protein n=1 Tax=Alkalilimnicola ehrlichii (strain ATCC BAA-1101 / DSM 17681 / MLHE-1) TaxID=187272 RepID=Q0AC57_ALKEH|nr:thioredoxin domain-containing protein [Alkalilimnicola ehrlichii]ABI55580.1 protein of unknown function DUF255 [Alkalilimnicola ehrlichii MLHE-1]
MAAVGNRLGDATSPYLLQHADNPVHWQPWDDRALALAREQGKPILLSIGYSACHWCHVMAHESFEDPAIARLMNERFINIKVDREERPDLDRIYQTAHQLLTRRPGGWPLTLVLTPDDQTPVFAGTYFPPDTRGGMPGFADVLRQVDEAIRSQPQAVADQNRALRHALGRLAHAPADGGDAALGNAPLRAARDALADSFDRVHGGFGAAPKFPHPGGIERLLRHYALTLVTGDGPDRDALHMACHTLRRMALGGIYDQVGGGFARYSVDEYWMIPHFEKMLCDNALLLGLYADAWHATGDGLYARVVQETAEWVRAEMERPEGGYCTSLDADSEGGEGRYYLWTPDEVRELLDEDEWRLVEHRFGLDEPANFEGRWHLHVQASFSESARRLGRPREQVVALWQSARQKLQRARGQRVRPGRDDKVLTAWNGLMIAALARAGRLLDEPAWTASALRALGFLRERLADDQGRLYASWRAGRAAHQACLEDYAYLLEGVLECLQSEWSDDRLGFALHLADTLLERFQDKDEGGFWMTADDHEPLIHRPRPLADDSLPSGNAVALRALQRLGHLLGEPRYLEAVARGLRAAAGAIARMPEAHASLLTALEEYLYPPEIVVIRGAPEVTGPWRTRALKYYTPNRLVFALPADAAPPGVLSGRQTEGAAPAAWVCSGKTCRAPVRSLDELERVLAHPDFRSMD